jgi:hypothetical protein
MLLRLMYANNFAFEHPPVSIGIDPDKAFITVWSRQALSELHDDIRCDWFDRFVRIVNSTRLVQINRHKPPARCYDCTSEARGERCYI